MSKKAANNMGTIRKRTDGRWEARYTAPNGKRRSVYGSTQKAAAEALRAAQREIDTGAWLEPSRMTMNEWFDTWLRDYQSHTTGRTLETYTCVIKRHMRPIFGDVRLANFSAIHVRRMITKMTDAGRAPSTIRHAKAILSASLAAAAKDGLIKSNPAIDIRTPKLLPKTYTIIDREQIPAFMTAVNATSCPDALVFLLLTGVRLNEMCGLCWADVDLDASIIHIRRQLYAPSVAAREFRPPKDREIRDIYVSKQVVDLLKAHRKRRLADRFRAGESWQDDDVIHDLVFRTVSGGNLTETILNTAMAKIRAIMNLPGLRIHDLRHSYAVAALRSGVDVKTVQHNLGHKHASVTLDIYAAYTDDAGKQAAEKLAIYFESAGST